MNTADRLRAMTAIRRLLAPMPHSTLEARLEKIAAIASGKVDPKPKPKRQATPGRDRMERGGHDRGAPEPDAAEPALPLTDTTQES